MKDEAVGGDKGDGVAGGGERTTWQGNSADLAYEEPITQEEWDAAYREEAQNKLTTGNSQS